MHSRAYLASLVLLLVCGSIPLVNGIRFDYTDASLYNYTSDGFRIWPFQRVGIYGPDTMQVKATGRFNQAKVNVHLTIKNLPHEHFEVFIYNALYVEKALWRDRPHVQACADFGQDNGIYIPQNSTQSIVSLKATRKNRIDAGLNPDYEIHQEVLLMSTGLYVLMMDACRFVYKDERGYIWSYNPGDRVVTRQLDAANWDNIRITGYVSFSNPFGYLPGQAYGALPFYCIAFIICLALLIAMLIGAWRLGFSKTNGYQWIIVQMAVFSMLSYMFLVIYFGHLNETDVNAKGFFIFAEVFLLIRATYCRFAVFMIAWGYQIVKPTMPTKMAVGVFAGCAVHFLVSLIMLIVSETSGNNSAADHANIVAATGMGAKEGLQVGAFIIEVIVAVIIFLALRNTSAQVAGDPGRFRMFRQMGILLTVYAVAGSLWFLYSTFAPWGVGTLNEENWESWWLNAAGWEVAYVAILIGIVYIWFPSQSTAPYLQVQSFEDDASYAGVRGAARPSSSAGFKPLGATSSADDRGAMSHEMTPAPAAAAAAADSPAAATPAASSQGGEAEGYSSGLPA